MGSAEIHNSAGTATKASRQSFRSILIGERIREEGNCIRFRRAAGGQLAEQAAGIIFRFCGLAAVLGVAFITLYMIISGTPALFRVGLKEILFGRVWMPTAEEPRFGILYVILTSFGGTALAVLLGAPVGILTAVFLAEKADRRAAEIFKFAVELLACIPSVIYGLLGLYLLNPLIYRLELRIFADSESHRFTGGSNLLSAVIVLAIMILPTVISVSETAIRAVEPDIRAASLALGASRMQTVFRAVLPAAKPGIVTAVVLGVGRALGEATAVTLVSGGSVDFPLPFHSVRFLTTAIVSEMGYAQGAHREMLFTIGLVLFLFNMAVNIGLNRILKERGRGL
ncbi:MAG: phosphate ABC transporter permease subunit PstC [Firmicutes bacterium]|nr:phosphate ABC transporter permease subunit PstC [Bacillota bacterium]